MVRLDDLIGSILQSWGRPGRRRLLTSIAALTLGAGIGVSTAVFSLVDGILLRPLPVQDPERVLAVRPIRPSAPKDQAAYSIADYHAFRAASRAFSALSA